MALVGGGGYAEYVAVHMGCAMRIPEGISMIEAGGSFIEVSWTRSALESPSRHPGNISYSIPRIAIDRSSSSR